MCGVVGVVAKSDVLGAIYDGLSMLQHRGQDAAGIATCEGDRLGVKRGNGLIRDVISAEDSRALRGTMGIGHVRYPTAGSASADEAQPFYVNSPFGLALAHNGNLTNAGPIKRELFRSDHRHINTDSDSEVMLNVLAHELQARARLSLAPDDVFDAIARLHQRCRGAYACVGLIVGKGLFAFRDPHGIRPLVLGRRETPSGAEFMIASESVALDVVGFSRVRDVGAGEAVFITPDGEVHTRRCASNAILTPCIFEHVYLARPDSLMDEVSVYKARLRMGEKLGAKIARAWSGHQIDVVIPIPDTSRTAALQLSAVLNIKYREGFIKNRYVGRTFIMPGQAQRQKSIRRKLNPIELEFAGKNVLLVDDSIVRGNTSRQIVQMARDAGARAVYFASAAPPVRHPNVYGIDMPAASELVAAGRSVAEVCRIIGADDLIYQDLSDLIAAGTEGNPGITGFEASVFDGLYVTGDVDDAYLDVLGAARSDDVRWAGHAGVATL